MRRAPSACRRGGDVVAARGAGELGASDGRARASRAGGARSSAPDPDGAFRACTAGRRRSSSNGHPLPALVCNQAWYPNRRVRAGRHGPLARRHDPGSATGCATAGLVRDRRVRARRLPAAAAPAGCRPSSSRGAVGAVSTVANGVYEVTLRPDEMPVDVFVATGEAACPSRLDAELTATSTATSLVHYGEAAVERRGAPHPAPRVGGRFRAPVGSRVPATRPRRLSRVVRRVADWCRSGPRFYGRAAAAARRLGLGLVGARGRARIPPHPRPTERSRLLPAVSRSSCAAFHGGRASRCRSRAR